MQMRQFLALIAINLFMAMFSQVTAAAVYNLQSYDLSNGYSYNGSLTTDDRIGLFDSVDPIVDWNIAIFTPDDINGTREQILTPDNSSLSSFFLGLENAGRLSISRSEIVLTPGARNGFSAELFFQLIDRSSDLFNDDSITFDGAILNAPGRVIIQEVDGQDFIGFGESINPQLGPLVVANAVPIPTAALFFAPSIASLFLFARLRKKA